MKTVYVISREYEGYGRMNTEPVLVTPSLEKAKKWAEKEEYSYEEVEWEE